MLSVSKRMWIEQEPLLQQDDVTDKLKTKLYNFFIEQLDYFLDIKDWRIDIDDDLYSKDIFNIFSINIQKWREDKQKYITHCNNWEDPSYFIPDYLTEFKNSKLNERTKWYIVYDDIEKICCLLFKEECSYFYPKKFEEINSILKEENSAYLLSDYGFIIPITNKEELETVNEATTSPYAPVNEHIQKAISLFKKEPADYANSIKESISAVEALCQIIIDDEKATLGKAIKKLKEKGVMIPPALEEAFNKLYGYTSNEGGIRHALSEGDTQPTFDDAKYMLVSCSAFVNYLISKMN